MTLFRFYLHENSNNERNQLKGHGKQEGRILIALDYADLSRSNGPVAKIVADLHHVRNFSRFALSLNRNLSLWHDQPLYLLLRNLEYSVVQIRIKLLAFWRPNHQAVLLERLQKHILRHGDALVQFL